MSSVYRCFVSQHDMVLIGVGVSICMLATLSAISLFAHAGQSRGRMRAVWIGVAALAGGVGIWAVHFVAMLAFDPGVASGYRVGPTAASLVVAVLFTSVGLAVALRSPQEPTALLGGAVLGLGILATHYSGMAGYEVAGSLTFDGGAIVLSSIFAIFLASAALWVVRWRWRNHQAFSALILSAGICAHHLIVMGGVTVHPDPLVLVSTSAISARLLALPVAMASILALAVSMLGLVADIRSKNRAKAEADRMRTLADAAVEGLVICDRDAIVTINTSFAALTGFTPADLVGQPLSRCIPDRIALQRLMEHPNRIFESELDTRSDGVVPVELIMHGIDFAGRRHCAIAVRDIRSRKLAEERIHYLAHHDVLTGLPNRGWFNTRLDEAIDEAKANGASFTVLCLDLDRFKEVNDLFGHPAGDDVLRAMGRILSNLLVGPQVVARLGGDEFAILVPDIGDAVGVGRLADSILRATSEQSALAGSGPRIGTSIGIALYPGDGADRHNLLSAADTALHRAKSEGRGSYCFYESDMGAQVRDRAPFEGHAPDQRTATRSDFRSSLVLEIFRKALHLARLPAIDLAVATENLAVVRIAETHGGRDQREEDGIKVEGRTADHFEDVGGGGLLLQGLVQIATARIDLVLELGAVDRHRRLVGKSAGEFERALRELAWRLAQNGERPDRLSGADQRNDENGSVCGRETRRTQNGARQSRQILNRDRRIPTQSFAHRSLVFIKCFFAEHRDESRI